MKKIILLSDTHSYLDPRILPYFEGVHEIWHAGDIGDQSVITTLEKYAPLKAVHGNIDDHQIRNLLPELMEWEVEGVGVMMTHIGGRPPKFEHGIRLKIQEKRPRIFVSGHSHILLVQYIEDLNCLVLNPGACGKSGWHKKQTLLRFQIHQSDITNMEVIELERRPSSTS